MSVFTARRGWERFTVWKYERWDKIQSSRYFNAVKRSD